MSRLQKKQTICQSFLKDITNELCSIDHLKALTNLDEKRIKEIELGENSPEMQNKLVCIIGLIQMLKDPAKHQAMEDLLITLKIKNPEKFGIYLDPPFGKELTNYADKHGV
jgi:hypothetical protein